MYLYGTYIDPKVMICYRARAQVHTSRLHGAFGFGDLPCSRAVAARQLLTVVPLGCGLILSVLDGTSMR